MWHLRLRHLPFSSLQYLFPEFRNIDVKNKILYTIYTLAKMTRCSFTPSSIKTCEIFYMPHIDILGPMIPLQEKIILALLPLLMISLDLYGLYWLNINLISHLSLHILMNLFSHNSIKKSKLWELSEGETLSFYNAKGIKHQTSCVDTPQQTFLKLLEHCFFNQKYLRLFGVIVCNVQHTWSIKCPSLFWTKKFPLKYYILRHHHMICSSPLVALPMLQLWKRIDPNLIQEHKGQQLNNGQQLSKYEKVGLFKNNS